jgi:hypothetical protein
MPSNKKLEELSAYRGVLPYASEIFGVYQPLIGWKSKRIAERFNAGLGRDKQALLHALAKSFRGEIQIEFHGGEDRDCSEPEIKLAIGQLVDGQTRKTDSILLNVIGSNLPSMSRLQDDQWENVLSDDQLDRFLNNDVRENVTRSFVDLCKDLPQLNGGHSREQLTIQELKSSVSRQLKYESAIAGMLQLLRKEKQYSSLIELFYSGNSQKQVAESLARILSGKDSAEAYLNIDNLDPRNQEHIRSVALSPISVVHLYRQFFFELDTFLGTPVSHVWMSPGSTVELIETHTTRTLVERTVESSIETTLKSEQSRTEKEELSETTKEDNKQDIKLGAGVTATYMSITATASFDFNSSQQTAREKSYKRTREQSEKLSSEIRKNYKTTFKTVTETTDTSSKRYVISNSTDKLINYELRRKMRQVGVQVQDIGTYLCWQSYVDDPGASLGIAELVHVAKKPDLEDPPHPEKVVPQKDFSQEIQPVRIPFVPTNDHDDRGEDYDYGAERNEEDEEDKYRIQWEFPQTVSCEKPEYEFYDVQLQVTDGNAVVEVRDKTPDGNRGSFTIVLKHVHFGDRDAILVKPTIFWRSTQDTTKVEEENQKQLKEFQVKEEKAYKDAFVVAAKDRVKLASKIVPRPSDELREEERIVVYRKLIQDMLMNGIAMPDDATRHIVAELINDIFDVEKMLYFVAPEWWRPRLHQSHQNLGMYVKPTTSSVQTNLAIGKDAAAKIAALPALAKGLTSAVMKLGGSQREKPLNEHVVGWGGTKEARDDNYYITEDSEPAKLGSSLGWLLQLDGDNMRNAFLNAPWVKAIIPIRPGKEEAAINWLKGVEGFNGITDADIYRTKNSSEKDVNGNPLDGQKLIDVIFDLAKKIKLKHEEGVKAGKYPKPQELADPQLVDNDNTVTATPIDRVFEHGFYPLKGGFKANVEQNFELIAQWVEVLPTDQVVPVEVRYDSKSGRQI